MADDRDKDQRRAADGDATVPIPAELLSILPPPPEAEAATPPPPGPAATPPPPPGPAVPPPPPPDPVSPPPARTSAADVPPRRGGGLWLVGALVVVVAFIAACYLLVAQAEDDVPSASDLPTPTTAASETTAPTSTTAPTPSTQAPADLSVVVLNGTSEIGWAGENVATLAEAGYTAEASDAAAEIDTTTVYIAEESLAPDGAAVATAIGLPDAPVEPRPEEPLGVTDAADDADVVVVLGADSVG